MAYLRETATDREIQANAEAKENQAFAPDPAIQKID
jgi:hypothetical protein